MIRAVLGWTGVVVRLEFVRRREVSMHTTIESSSNTLATFCSLKSGLHLVVLLTVSSLTLVDHPDVLPFVSVSSSRLFSNDSFGLIWLILGRARV